MAQPAMERYSVMMIPCSFPFPDQTKQNMMYHNHYIPQVTRNPPVIFKHVNDDVHEGGGPSVDRSGKSTSAMRSPWPKRRTMTRSSILGTPDFEIEIECGFPFRAPPSHSRGKTQAQTTSNYPFDGIAQKMKGAFRQFPVLSNKRE